MATDKQQAIWTQNDALVVSKIAREEFDRFLANPTEENRWWAIHSQNAASDYYHCALHAMNVVPFIVMHPGEGRGKFEGFNTTYSHFTPEAKE